MQQKMIRILYSSTARADIEESDIEAIIAQATKANKARNITGALAFNGWKFCQCLEGDEKTVRELLALISQDDRHSDLRIHADMEIEARYFGNWAMRWIFGCDFSEIRCAMRVTSRIH